MPVKVEVCGMVRYEKTRIEADGHSRSGNSSMTPTLETAFITISPMHRISQSSLVLNHREILSGL